MGKRIFLPYAKNKINIIDFGLTWIEAEVEGKTLCFSKLATKYYMGSQV